MHACPSDCILYRKEYEDSTNCPTCGISRWKEGKDSIVKGGVPAKVVWYFLLIPRFKRMFRSHETAKSLTWHAARKSINGQMSHPADSPSWKLLDDKWPEFESLWDGIRGVYDAHNGEYFTLRAALMWTINDFPAYGNLSGCVVKGYKVCPICGDNTPSHRRQRATFNGKLEYGTPPEPLTGEEVLHMVEYGDRVCWKKKSIFFDLEYWKYLLMRHVLDVMHIEKNVCDNIIGTLLEIPGKNKDGIAARLDLLNMGVKTDLQPAYGKRRTRLPPGPWNLSRAEKIENRTRPEGCIAERYIAEEAVEFCTEHLYDVSTVGVPSSQKMGVSKPLSGCTVSVVDRDLLNQAHLYVLENTEEVLPYIEQHMIHIKTAYPKFRNRTKWLQDKHNSTFIQWLRFKVQSELNEEDNHGVLENLRWLVASPNMAVPSYRSYLIKGIKFNIKAQDDVRTTQNSGIYLLAHTMQVASAKDKNSILSNMGFYGVIQEIWDLDYQKFTIPVFRCDWIDSTSGLVVDELGFTLVDLSKIGHRNDQFVLASQVKQVFFVDDTMHRGWSIVLSMPNREYNDVIGDDDVLGDVRIECEPFTRGMPNVDTFDELVGEFGSQNIRDGCKDIWIE
ncbi:unnamed protein product [Prunus armeniaca]